MPQASDELRDKMGEYFGNRIDDSGPTHFLKSQGHTLTSKWEWELSAGKQWKDLSEKEKDCIYFLVDEWDFGGVTNA